MERGGKCFFLSKITGMYIDMLTQKLLKIYENEVGDSKVYQFYDGYDGSTAWV